MDNDRLDELIQKGQQFNFRNNCYSVRGEYYSKASNDLLVWIVCVEDIIMENYGENSAPYRLYQEFDRSYLDGFYQDDFDKQLSIIFSALRACKEIAPKPKSQIFEKDELLSNLFERFHSVAKQLRHRYDNRPTLDINDEYDVQDLLHSLLKLYFEDIRKEEWTPSYAGGSSRMDFF